MNPTHDNGGVPTRTNVLSMLSRWELASVSASEANTHLRRGDQYLSLDHLELGVLRADGTATTTEHLLPRKAVHEDTWRRILRHLKVFAALTPAK